MTTIEAVSAFYDNYIWVLIQESQAICVDPGEAKPVLDFLKRKGLRLQSILLTHHHHDHIGGVTELLKIHPDLAIYGPKDKRIPEVTQALQGGDQLTIGSLAFQILATPGHTSTHISYYEPHHGWLFCGDTLFSGGCGRVFDGTIEELHDSLQQLKTLADNTQVFCAHEYTLNNLRFAARVEPDNAMINSYVHRLLGAGKRLTLPSSLAIEKQINPFLRTQSASIQAFARAKGSLDGDSLSVFKTIRAEKDHF